MGLDMYIEAEHYIGGGYNFMRKNPADPETRRFDAVLAAFGLGVEEFKARYAEGNYVKVAFEVAYWRKANAVHAWFVKNIQNDKDDCQRSYVDRDKLVELRDVCQKILATVVKGEPVKQSDGFGGEWDSYPNLTLDREMAGNLLPPQSGFFFGSTSYDEWYAARLEETVAQIDAILDDPVFKDATFYYRASW